MLSGTSTLVHVFVGYKIVQKFSSDITLYKSKSNFQHKHQNDHIDWN